VIISSIVLFFRRDSCGAGPAVDVPSVVEVETPKPLAVDVVAGAAGAVVVPVVVVGGAELAAFPTIPKMLDDCVAVDVTGAVVAGVEVITPVGLPRELNRLGV
jgi:hypothetical protein